jgi:hypothetical protein
MKVVYNSFLPLKGFSAINLFGIIFIRSGYELSKELYNHEAIHFAQMKELLFVFFYLFYFIEWIVKLFRYGKRSYYHLSFEREAYSNDLDLDYLKNRKPYAFRSYILLK